MRAGAMHPFECERRPSFRVIIEPGANSFHSSICQANRLAANIILNHADACHHDHKQVNLLTLGWAFHVRGAPRPTSDDCATRELFCWHQAAQSPFPIHHVRQFQRATPCSVNHILTGSCRYEFDAYHVPLQELCVRHFTPTSLLEQPLMHRVQRVPEYYTQTTVCSTYTEPPCTTNLHIDGMPCIHSVERIFGMSSSLELAAGATPVPSTAQDRALVHLHHAAGCQALSTAVTWTAQAGAEQCSSCTQPAGSIDVPEAESLLGACLK